MAAARATSPLRLVDLPQVRVSALDALLDEETGQWQAMLGWDFRPSAAMVRRLVGLRTLAGAALMAGETAFGYAYVCLLYTSDAADDLPCVDLGRRRILKATIPALCI